MGFWKRVLLTYNEFKPRGAKPRDAEQIRKKFGRILTPTRKFAGIYGNNLLNAESGRNEADVKALSVSQYNALWKPKFTHWEEFLVLENCPKFKSICAEETEGSSRYSAFASGSHSAQTPSGAQSVDPGPHVVLNRNLNVQLMKQLQENYRFYESATDPITKAIYYELMCRIREDLGLTGSAVPSAQEARAAGAGAAAPAEVGDEEEAEDSNSATE
ncbi:uncharacterized protein LOC125206633 [Salvia hispanica]|uniref:uncharacterized protein LOC125206633 n=1 Tax=Salvia hispanica TaxID=49212 RepID=UPI002009BF6B|nr:uncharacterized protein LOC125206633 [Salvia hispanica]